MNLIEKAMTYANGVRIITEWLGSGAKTVDPVLAQQRTNICLGCEKNITGPAWPFKVAEAIREQLELKKDLNLRTAGERNLDTCGVCSCVLKLKVWVPIERLRPQHGEEFPDFCWVKKESDDYNSSIQRS